jgi:hypothetical protein
MAGFHRHPVLRLARQRPTEPRLRLLNLHARVRAMRAPTIKKVTGSAVIAEKILSGFRVSARTPERSTIAH